MTASIYESDVPSMITHALVLEALLASETLPSQIDRTKTFADWDKKKFQDIVAKTLSSSKLSNEQQAFDPKRSYDSLIRALSIFKFSLNV
jgi:hypothetical protein